MNLAISALLIILALLPAFLFKLGVSAIITSNRQYDSAGHRNVQKALSKLTFTETVFLFSIIPIILHLVSLSMLQVTRLWDIDYGLLLNIFAGKDDVLDTSRLAHEQFGWKLMGFLFYTLVESLLGFCLGCLLLLTLGNKQWVLKILVGNNKWFKLFSGYLLPTWQRGRLDFIIVDVLVTTREATLIYSGILQSYDIPNHGDDLSSIDLSAPSRRDLRSAQMNVAYTDPHTPENKETSTYYDSHHGDIVNIPGDILTIPGREILYLTITYMTLQEDDGEKRAVPLGPSLRML